MNHQENYDILIIGSGGSGLTAAISAHDNGAKKIAIISKVLPNYSHTVAAKGGINAALSNVEPDQWLWHAYDTIKASDFIADTDSVEILCNQAKKSILYLEKFGVAFSRSEDGKIAQRAYGGQTSNFGQSNSIHRACYAQDRTGFTIHNSLYQQALMKSIKFYNEYFVVKLIFVKNICFGCVAIDLNNGELVIFRSKIIIIATGGYSQIYNNTTSSTIVTGDGLSLAFKEGVALQDVEFSQFHPTGIHNYGFLITEAVRGEGGYLLNSKMERFMTKYDPKMMELSSRDIIARAMATEIAIGNGCGLDKDHLYIDLRHIGQENIGKKLPGVAELVAKFCNLDVCKDLIPVSPSAHYSMGGILVNNDCVALDGDCNEINGLMAVGEAACISVHGANRLGCNSLLDLIVFGIIAGKKAANYTISNSQKYSDEIEIDNKIKEIINEFNRYFDENNQNNFNLEQEKIKFKKFNDLNLGVFRNHDSLQNGLKYCKDLLNNLKKYKFSNKSLIWNEELINFIEFENLILCAYASYFAAINRCESRGSHYRKDFPDRDQKFLAHSLVKIDKDYNLQFSLKKVRTETSYNDLKKHLSNALQ